MKNILVPTDFSKNAEKALNFALALAYKFGATLHIIHAYNTTSHAGHLANIDRVIKEDRDKEMNKFLEETRASISFDLKIEGRCRKGNAQEIIQYEANKTDSELIIMGTLGASNISKKMLGSTTSHLIKNITTPVLAIPTDTPHTDLENLVVALDAHTSHAPDVLDPMVAIALKLNLKINLVHISNNETHTDIDPAIKKRLASLEIPFSFTKVESDDVLGGILNFTKDKGSSLLCMVARQRGWFENLFHHSVSQQISLQSDLPLLILHDSKNT